MRTGEGLFNLVGLDYINTEDRRLRNNLRKKKMFVESTRVWMTRQWIGSWLKV